MALIKKKTAVFISGRGTNLNNLIKFSKKKISPIEIKLVISDNFKAKGIMYAKKNKIKFKIFKDKNKKLFEKKLLIYLKKNEINFICLAGFMRIISKEFINKFGYKILNIHPSLLPKYKGLNTHERVLKSNDKFSGCTVHYVNKKLDSGKIILQKKIRIEKNENVKSLKKKVLKIEHEIYPKSILKILK